MLLIECPNCGVRDETEFNYGGQAHVPYPENPEELTDRQWAEYLFFRDNPKGIFAERWVHSAGCRRWFNTLRDTVTYDISAVYRMGEQPGGQEPVYVPVAGNATPAAAAAAVTDATAGDAATADTATASTANTAAPQEGPQP